MAPLSMSAAFQPAVPLLLGAFRGSSLPLDPTAPQAYPVPKGRCSRPQKLPSHRISRCALKTDWTSLSLQSFDEKLKAGELPIAMVGMSNCGKSHWSSQLSRHHSFHLICVDERIETAIEPQLSALGFSGIDGMAEWMGFPTDDRFIGNQNTYLRLEEHITAASPPQPGRNTVLDTTGSVVYLSEDTLSRLRTQYLVVHLEASDDMLDVMTNSYFETPKPVVWGDAFNRHEGETPNQALRRCYPNLLRERRKRYAALAHLTVPATVSLSRDVDMKAFLRYIRDQLPVVPQLL